MDGAATLTNLVHDVLDFIAQDLILLANIIQLEDGFFIGRLDSEELRGSISAFLLCSVKVHGGRFSFEFPFINKFVELLGFLLHGGIEKLSLVSLSSHILDVSCNLGLGFVNLSSLKGKLFNGSLGFSKSSLELQLVHLNVFSLGKTLSLILAPPHVRLIVGLGHLPQKVFFDTGFLIQMLLYTIKLMFKILEFAEKGCPILGFTISNKTSFFQLSLKLDLQLGQHVSLVFKFLKLFQQVSIFCSNLPLVVLKVTESKTGLFNLLVGIIERSKQSLVRFLGRGLGSTNFISSSTNILDLMHELGFVLLNLSLHLGKLINLFRHLCNGILVFFLQANESSFLLDVSFFQIFPQFSNLGFSLLVELNLSMSCTSSLIEPLTKALKLLGKVGSLPFSFSSGLPFSFQLLFQFFYPRLNLLDGFLNLGDNLLLIIQFAIEYSEILFFPLNCSLSLLLLPLQFRDRFLSYLEITFNPPPSFFNVSA